MLYVWEQFTLRQYFGQLEMGSYATLPIAKKQAFFELMDGTLKNLNRLVQKSVCGYVNMLLSRLSESYVAGAVI